MSGNIVIRTKIKLMNYLGGMVVSILEMANDDCGKPPRLKGTNCVSYLEAYVCNHWLYGLWLR